MTGPERIWIKPCHPCTEPDDYYVQHPDYTGFASIGYIRADIHDEVVKALREAVEIVHKAYVSAKMEAVNAGPNHPLAKQMGAWRTRCLRSENAARAALARTILPIDTTDQNV